MLVTSQHYLWKSSVIPNVAMVRKTIVNVAQFALFHVLFDRVQFAFLVYLQAQNY